MVSFVFTIQDALEFLSFVNIVHCIGLAYFVWMFPFYLWYVVNLYLFSK